MFVSPNPSALADNAAGEMCATARRADPSVSLSILDTDTCRSVSKPASPCTAREYTLPTPRRAAMASQGESAREEQVSAPRTLCPMASGHSAPRTLCPMASGRCRTGSAAASETTRRPPGRRESICATRSEEEEKRRVRWRRGALNRKERQDMESSRSCLGRHAASRVARRWWFRCLQQHHHSPGRIIHDQRQVCSLPGHLCLPRSACLVDILCCLRWSSWMSARGV